MDAGEKRTPRVRQQLGIDILLPNRVQFDYFNYPQTHFVLISYGHI